MMLADQVYAQAVLLTGVEPEQEALLQMFCRSAVAGLKAQLREGVTTEDCKADFVAAASLYAVAALAEADEMQNLSQIQIGDVTMRRETGGAAARCLRKQAELIMYPFVQTPFAFRRV